MMKMKMMMDNAVRSYTDVHPLKIKMMYVNELVLKEEKSQTEIARVNKQYNKREMLSMICSEY